MNSIEFTSVLLFQLIHFRRTVARAGRIIFLVVLHDLFVVEELKM